MTIEAVLDDPPPPLHAVGDELLAQIVRVSADAIFSEDVHGRITSWNAAAERLYGAPAAAMVGTQADRLQPDESRAELREVHQRALRGERVERFDTFQRRLDGSHFPVSLTVSPLRDGTGAVCGLATSVKEITRRVRQLEEAHRNLEHQVQALARSNRDLEQFAYVASHDLSEPLRVMTGFVELLQQRYAEVLDERGQRYVFHVVDGAARMRRLIEDLLEYSRFLARGQQGSWVDTTAVARRVVEQYADSDIEVESLPAVWSDEAAVSSVLQNLISNALKFHRPQTTTRVRVGGAREGDWVRLFVDDDGIGVAEEYRDKVFGMFSRLHVREAYAGTGIGLAIVKTIAERADGHAWVEDSPYGGSRFCVTFPAVAPKAPVA